METPKKISVKYFLSEPGCKPAIADAMLEISSSGISVAGPAAEACNLLAMPAPVNAHDHGYGIRTLDFGCADDALEPWIAGLRKRPPTDPYLEALVAFGRLALNGCGATMHCHNSLRVDSLSDEIRAVSRAAQDCGIRLAVSCPLLDTSAWIYGGPERLRELMTDQEWPQFEKRIPNYPPFTVQIEAVTEIFRGLSGEMLDIQFGPIGPQWASDEMLEAIADASEQLGCRIHMHLLESPRQRRWLDERFPDGVVRHLDRIGFLSPRLAVAHGVQLRPDECELLSARGVIVASNPSANLRLRSGIAPVREFRRAGLKYALGLDGTGFSDDQDIWQEMRLFHLLHGGTGLEPCLPEAEIYDAVINHGAAVLNQRPGLDLVTIDLSELECDLIAGDPDHSTLLLGRMTGSMVRDLFVAGRKIVANKEITGFDFKAARAELTAQARSSAPTRNDDYRFSDRLADTVRNHYRRMEP